MAERLEPQEVQEVQDARVVIRRWELRNGHDAYPEPLDGGWLGYQARCWDCDWRGTKYLRGDGHRGKKNKARKEAARHQRETKAQSDSDKASPPPDPADRIRHG